MRPLPLVVLTGFLGSGKTSTLSHWLGHTGTLLKRTAVIINDFGAVNVDAALLSRRQLELRSITGGCVCCQSFDDLVLQVRTLSENPDLDLVWIETSGLADPEEVLDHLSVPELQDRAVVRRLILVIDGSDFPCSWRGKTVQEEQIRYADLILLNKTDRIDDKTRREVEAALRELNPSAQIVISQHGQADPELLSGGESVKAPQPHDHHEAHEHHHDGEHDCCKHDHGTCENDHDHDHSHEEELPHAASTLFIPLNAPVEQAAFQRFLKALPESVFRAKGFVRLTSSPKQLHTFQKVRDQEDLLILPLEGESDIATGLVLIGPHLDENRIRELATALVPAKVS